jgi:3-dehydroquinate synthase
MIFAAELSRIQNGLTDEVVGDHYELLESLELPVTYKLDSWPSLLQFMARDKKRKTHSIRFVTLVEPGGTSRSEFASELLETIYKDKIAR